MAKEDNWLLQARLTELHSIVRCQPELLSGSANTTVDEHDEDMDNAEHKLVHDELHRYSAS